VYQQMGRVVLDSDWNEEIRIRTTDARRRTGDVAEGAPDDGFRIDDAYVLDATGSTAGWSGVGLPTTDQRYIPPVLALDRKELASLPFVVRSHGYTSLQRTLPAPLDLQAVPPRPLGTPGYSVAALVVGIRFDVPTNEQESTDVRLLLVGPGGQVAVLLAVDPLPTGWTVVRIPASALGPLVQTNAGGVTTTIITSWGLTGLPPRATVWIDSLRAEPAGLDRSDFTILGGDGTLAGAGRMFVGGARAFLPADIHYLAQDDYPDPVALADLVGTTPPPPDGHYFVYLDLWELPVTALDDGFLVEPALDGLDTTTRLKLVQQVRAAWVAAGGSDTLPAPTGGGALTTSFVAGDPRPFRYAPDRTDPARLGALFTESIATQTGYRGTTNVHVRVEVMSIPGTPAPTMIALWSRDNGSTVAMLTQDAPQSATSVVVSSEDVTRFSAGDLVVVEDHKTRLQPEGPHRFRVLRRITTVDPDTGTLTLAVPQTPAPPVGDPQTIDPNVPLPTPFLVSDHAALRRWDGADFLVAGQLYNLSDGITFAFSGDPSTYRSGDYWSFTARIDNPDGQAQGYVDLLVEVPPQGPVHRYAPLAQITEAAGVRTFTDVRPRFLPLASVRDRLRELEVQAPDKGPFAIVVGDGVSTFGDVDQDTVQGVTGDEAIQTALGHLQGTGGTLYVRAGAYVLERPILIEGMSRVRIVGDGDGTLLRALGTGGAIVVYACGQDAEVTVEHMWIREEPFTGAVIGKAPAVPAPTPPQTPLALTDLKVASTGPALPVAPLVTALAATLVGTATIPPIGPSQGRTFASIVVTLERLRALQKANPGVDLNTIPEAAAILHVLTTLPHGVVTVADSSSIRILDCHLHSEDVSPLSAGVFVTGATNRVEIARNRIETAAGVVASPLTPYFSDTFLGQHPAAALAATDLRVTDNDVTSWGQAVYGVWIGDGTFNGVRVAENRIADFAIGIQVADRAELRGDDPASRIELIDNRVTGSVVTGILVTGDGVDVAGNEVRNAAADSLFKSSGLFHAAIQVAGQGVRVRDSWIELPGVGTAPVLGVYAGIVVGDGLDDGVSTARAVYDVDVTGNRIEGAGAATPAAGVLVGGPNAVFDVRIRANVIRNLGDAAVRLLGTGIAAGRIVVEDNRVEEVALAEIPGVDPDLAAQVALLAPRLPSTVGPTAYTGGPQALLSALVSAAAAAPDAVRGPLDATLRWIERLTLRGGIVASRAEDTQIKDNRLIGVGYYAAAVPARSFSAEVRTAAVAMVGGSNLLVADNHLEEVRAPVGQTGATAGPSTPVTVADAAIDALNSLGTGTAASADSSAELHAAAASLHRTLLAAAENIPTPPATLPAAYSGKIFGSLDAMTSGFVSIGETSFAQSFSAQVGLLRGGSPATPNGPTQPTGPALLAILDALRVHLVHVCTVTAGSATSTAAWQAVEDLESAIVAQATDPHNNATAVATTMTNIAGNTTLLGALPPTRKSALTADLAKPPADPRAVVDLLAQAAAILDEADLDTGIGASDVFGHRVDIVTSLATGLSSSVATAALTLTTAGATINGLASDVSGLVQMLQEAGADLSRYLLVDFGNAQASPTAANLATLKSTLDEIVTWAQGTAATPTDPDVAANNALRIDQARQDASLQLLGIDDLDQRLTELDSLGEVTAALADAALSAVSAGALQLSGLLQGPAFTAGLNNLTTAITAAGSAAPADRPTQLDNAHSALDQLRSVVEDVATATGTDGVQATPTDMSERRVAGLGALVLALQELGPGSGDVQTRALDLLAVQVQRAVAETDGGSSSRSSALDSVTAASSTLKAATSPASAVASAIYQLATLVQGIASNLADAYDSPGMLAASVMLQAVRLGLDPSTKDDATRLSGARTFLAGRTSMVSPAVVDRLTTFTALADALTFLRQQLERLAVGEATPAGPGATPVIPTLPDPADGIFASTVEDQLWIGSNAILTALNAIVVTGPAGHVLADPGDGSTPAPVLIDVLDNLLRGCAVGAIDVFPGADAVITVADNRVTSCVDLAAPAGLLARAGAPALLATLSQAVVRASGQGTLVLSSNVFQGNGHGFPAAVLHEVLVDWRGDLVVRSNSINHTGGGAGGVALLLLVETLTDTADLVQRLATTPALAVEAPPPPNPSPTPVIRTPWRGLTFLPVKPQPVASSHYITKISTLMPVADIALLLWPRRPPPPVPPAPPPTSPRSTYVEGNHVRATGPALLVLGQGTDVVSATVSGNGLVSSGTTGAVYLRHVDATVFTGNQCQSLGSVNVVVMRFDAAPVAVTGNVIVGDQPVAQMAPDVIDRRNSVKQFVGMQIAQQAGVLPDVVAATTPQPAAGSTSTVGKLFGALGKTLSNIKLTTVSSAPSLLSSGLKLIKTTTSLPTKPTLVVPLVAAPVTNAGTPAPAGSSSAPAPTTTTPAPTLSLNPALIASVSATAPAPPRDPRSQSLVILGGTRVISAGNATTAGVYVTGADNDSENNL
jgi:hypothetical protein